MSAGRGGASGPPPFDPLPCPMPLIAKAKRHDGMGSALHSRAPRKLAGRWQLPPPPFYRTQPVKSAAYNERLGPCVSGGGSCHRGNTKGTRPFVPEAYSPRSAEQPDGKEGVR